MAELRTYHSGLVSRYVAERCLALGLRQSDRDVSRLPRTAVEQGVFWVSPPLTDRPRERGRFEWRGEYVDRETEVELELVFPRTPTQDGIRSEEYERLAYVTGQVQLEVSDPAHYSLGSGALDEPGGSSLGGIVMIDEAETQYGDVDEDAGKVMARTRFTAWYTSLVRS